MATSQGRTALSLTSCALLFALLTWQVVIDGPLRGADERWGRAVVGSRLPDRAAEFLADLGNIAVAVPVLAAVIAYVSWHARRAGTFRWWLPGLAAAVTMACVPALVAPLKSMITRPGPPGMTGEGGFYPSGHAATAAVAYGAAALLLLPLPHGAYGRRELVIGCVLLNAAIGFGLVRQGYHWPLDVVASWLLSAMLLQVMVLVVARVSRSTRRSSSRTPSC